MQLRVVRAGLASLSPLSASAASALAERLFLTAPRYRRPRWEAAVLASARRSTVTLSSGEAIPTWRWGAGPAVLLVHGWSGRGSQLGAFVAPLAAAGYEVVTFDGPGHGDAPSGHASIVLQARAVQAVAATLGRPVGVLAHSVGGAAALLAAHWSPSLAADRYVLIAPPASPARFVETFSETFELAPDVRRLMLGRVERRYGLTIADLDVVAAARRVNVPTLVVHDGDDREVDPDDGRRIAAALPHGELVETSGLGHRRILKDDAVVARATEFLHADGTPAAPGELVPGTLDGDLFFRYARCAP